MVPMSPLDASSLTQLRMKGRGGNTHYTLMEEPKSHSIKGM